MTQTVDASGLDSALLSDDDQQILIEQGWQCMICLEFCRSPIECKNTHRFCQSCLETYFCKNDHVVRITIREESNFADVPVPSKQRQLKSTVSDGQWSMNWSNTHIPPTDVNVLMPCPICRVGQHTYRCRLDANEWLNDRMVSCGTCQSSGRWMDMSPHSCASSSASSNSSSSNSSSSSTTSSSSSSTGLSRMTRFLTRCQSISDAKTFRKRAPYFPPSSLSTQHMTLRLSDSEDPRALNHIESSGFTLIFVVD